MMMRPGFRRPVAGLLALTALVAVPQLTTATVAGTGAGTAQAIAAEPELLAANSIGDIALIMGGTGMPDPTPQYLNLVNDLFIREQFPGYAPVPLHTPEESFPFVGFLSGAQSVVQGTSDLDFAMRHTYDTADNFLVVGLSQSALIAAHQMRNLVDHPLPGDPDVHFALLGDPTDPMGGVFTRFAGLDNTLVDLNEFPGTPTDLFPTDIYTGEYDGVSDFPRDLLNIPAILNAIAGVTTVHLGYADMTAEQFDSAVHLGQSGLTNFYMIPTEHLPILAQLYAGSASDRAYADLIEPGLRVLINLGYGNLQHGLVADPGALDGDSLMGFFPQVDPLATVAALQLAGVEGLVNAGNDILGDQGLPLLPDYVTDVLKVASGHNFTHQLDQLMISTLTQLSTLPGMAGLSPDTLFSGLPLVDGAPFISAINDMVNDFDTQPLENALRDAINDLFSFS